MVSLKGWNLQKRMKGKLNRIALSKERSECYLGLKEAAKLDTVHQKGFLQMLLPQQARV